MFPTDICQRVDDPVAVIFPSIRQRTGYSPLSPGNRWKQRDYIPVIERRIKSRKKMDVPAIFENVDVIPEGFRGGKYQIIQALITSGELSEK
jgi:hypothetical protein